MIRTKKKMSRDLPGRSMVPPPSPISSVKKKRKKKKKKKKKPPPLVRGGRTRLLEPGTLSIYEDSSNADNSTFQIFQDSPQLPRPQISPVSSPRHRTERPLPLFSPLSSPGHQPGHLRPRPLFSETKDDGLFDSHLNSPRGGSLDDSSFDMSLQTPSRLRLSPSPPRSRRSSRSPSESPIGPNRTLKF